ncbi:MAG TPA: DUF3617 family protein, partial [Rhodocyclaceae bacterium]|nr:DUF3617 family protein [Rhodocyclaceae bacterium]
MALRQSVCSVLWFVLYGTMTGASAQDMPHRKSGLWESTMESAQMKGRTVSSQQCVDEKTDADMQKRTLYDNNLSCTHQASKRFGNGWEYDSVCKLNDSTLTSHATMTGDFNNEYTVVIKGHREPVRNGIADTQTT